MSTHKQRVVIIGAGITGLSAAQQLHELAVSRKLEVDCVVLEASSHAGGIINTKREDGYVLELGADSFATHKPYGIDLVRKLGLEVQNTNPSNRRTCIASGNQVLPLPKDFRIVAPANIRAFLQSPLLSLGGKLRALLDFFIPPRTADGEESVARFMRRRLGKEAFEKIVQPMIGGLYTGDPERLSMQSSAPRLRAMERKHGSLIRAARAEIKAEKDSGTVATESGARYGHFVSFSQGLQTMVDTLVANLPKGWLRLNSPVKLVTKSKNGFQVYLSQTNEVIEADAIICATPAYKAAAMLAPLDPLLSNELDAIEHASSMVMNLVYKANQISQPLEGFGFVVPDCENRAIMACTYSSIKFNGRAPSDEVVIRVFLGGALQPKLCELSDAVIKQLVACDLENLLGITAKPKFSLITRYPSGMPQYNVGHNDRVDRIETHVAQLPGLELAGNSYRGVGIPDCIYSGQIAAQRIFDHLLITAIHSAAQVPVGAH